MEFYTSSLKWLNGNQGVLAVIIFLLTLLFGWISGIFRALQKKPRFKLSLIPGPTFTTTTITGHLDNGIPTHKTAIALYLSVANIGSAPSEIKYVKVGYHWDIKPFRKEWFKYRLGWFWLDFQTAALEDFHCEIGDKIKVFPFLLQGNSLTGIAANTYLTEGRVVNGVIYFEQQECWGASYPKEKNGKTKIKIAVVDANDKAHVATKEIDVVELGYARTFNPSFGSTLDTLNGQQT
ncbi:hypothetical protein C7Y69_11165 [Alteromonas sp. KS69]|jgi:hypothetical protein|uniref:hypothetical protein n=1 Tax=Alteromonas TaxID=226 RepID=UPI000F864B17|nr:MULTISPECIES: hypothetical protein [Alteromonas]RUP80607.1 hypothetical protein C7Y69_11165 [Alteromonas sp. KS69]|tara:strand:+ start:485 stop:1192 length:708 start_codon:yes stop_codon:yes gene_type:complete